MLRDLISDLKGDPFQHQINLFEGVDYYSLEKDFDALFDNFHPIYYLYDYWGVRVQKSYNQKNGKSVLQFDLMIKDRKKSEMPEFISVQLNRIKKKQKYSIEYFFGDGKLSVEKASKSSPNITATFLKRPDKHRIDIEILDKDRWFLKQLKQIHQGNKNKLGEIEGFERSSINRKIDSRTIEYYYKEPESERNKQFPQLQNIYSLALQGGGVKGISYIGVNEALRNKFGDEVLGKIKNIIGSSAGGILGLAICCEMEKKQLESIVKTLGNIPQKDRIPLDEFKGQKQGQQNQFIRKLKDLLIDLGIVKESVISLIESALADKEIQRLIIKLIEAYNSKLLGFLLDDNKQLNFERLINGELMYGDQISKIACTCLKKVFKNFSDQQLKKVTFRELYQKNEKQFTCTSVDLRGRIIRFFNHKTTPDMPVAIAVQMTGSFPVAFRRQKWKKQWGKYYIHYYSTRREINLEGNEFTDGGMLSNFPMKYLDNQYMRPMYFSHKKTQKTELFGFGLLQVQDEKYKSETSKNLKAICDDLQKQFKLSGRFMRSQFLSCDAFKKYFSCPFSGKKTTPLKHNYSQKKIYRDSDDSGGQEDIQEQEEKDLMKQLRKIPLLKFGINLLMTYLKSDVNFEKECFAQECYSTSFNGNPKTLKNTFKKKWFKRYSHQNYIKQMEQFIDQMKKLIYIDESKKKLTIMKNVSENIDFLLNKLNSNNESNIIREDEIVNVATQLKSVLVSLIIKGGKEVEKEKALRETIDKMTAMIQPTIFYGENIVKDQRELIELIPKIKKNLVESTLFGQLLVKIAEDELFLQKKITKNIEQYYNVIKDKRHVQNFVPIPRTACTNWVSLENFNLILNFSQRKELYEKSFDLTVPQLAITAYSWLTRKQLSSYINRMLSRSYYIKKWTSSELRNNVHIIFESKHITELYFNEYISYIEQAIEDTNQIYNLDEESRFTIKTITASGYQSLVAFLYASKLPQQKISSLIWRIRESIEVEQSIKTKFDQKSWTQTNQKLIQQIQQQVWKNRYEFFQAIQNNVSKTKQFSELQRHRFQEEIMHLSNSREQLNLAFERVVSYSLDSLNAVRMNQKLQETEKIEQFHKLLTIQEKHRKKLQETNLKSKEFFDFILKRYEDLIKYTVLIYPSFNESFLQYIDSEGEESKIEAWKGALLEQTLKNIKFKNLIKETLLALNLSEECTLKEFHDSVLEKDRITVNLLAVESVNSKITIISHNTRPQMPVWAAILASSSVPFLHKPVSDSYGWRYSSQESYNHRILKKQFASGSSLNLEQYLQSGNSLSKIPLELITNHKISELIKSEKNETFLSFTFDDFLGGNSSNQDEEGQKMIVKKMKSMTLQPIGLRGVNRLKDFSAYMSAFMDINTVQIRLRQLKMYMNSHDNTFLDVYRKQSIQLPIKVSTLDFHRISGEKEGSGLSSIVTECIEDAQYVTQQKIDNTTNKGKQKKIFLRVRKMQIGEEKDDRKKIEKLSFEFLSAISQDFFDTTQRYRIFYKFSEKQPQPIPNMTDTEKYKINTGHDYDEILRDRIAISTSEASKKNILWLKIVYPSPITQEGKSEMKDSSGRKQDSQKQKQKQTQYQVEAVYHFIDFRQFLNRYNFSFIYEVLINKYYGSKGKTKIYAIKDPAHSIPLRIKSYYSELWTRFDICDKCGESIQGSTTKDYKKCVICQKSQKKIVFKCQHCKSLYCIYCKYLIEFQKNKMTCPLKHPVKLNQENRTSKYDEIMDKLCDVCHSYRRISYYDSDCKVNICDLCMMKQKLAM